MRNRRKFITLCKRRNSRVTENDFVHSFHESSLFTARSSQRSNQKVSKEKPQIYLSASCKQSRGQ